MTLLLVAVGGGLGAVIRYSMITMIALEGYYVIGLVNVFGSFLMGVAVMVASEGFAHVDWFKPLVMVGMLGGFTTFSAFAFDAVSMVQAGQEVKAMMYMALSVILSIAACMAGIMLVNR